MREFKTYLIWIAVLILIYTASILIGYQFTDNMDWNINESAIMQKED